MTGVSQEVDQLLKEYRHALDDGLGVESDSYFLRCVSYLNGMTNVGVAFSTAKHRLYVLVDGAGHEPGYRPTFLLDIAKELTEAHRTLVVPDQKSAPTTYWAGKKRGPIIAYRFKLIDEPSSLQS